MCLLDRVAFWDARIIECSSMTHLDPHNPLRRDGHLFGIHLIEYGAQAIAVHGGLLARMRGARYKPAYLAAISKARLFIDTTEGLSSELTITASIRAQLDAGVVYWIEVLSEARGMLAEAQATVVLLGEEAGRE